jgi:hypothetical protein
LNSSKGSRHASQRHSALHAVEPKADSRRVSGDPQRGQRTDSATRTGPAGGRALTGAGSASVAGGRTLAGAGSASVAGGVDGGSGLRGIAERVAMLGGTLSAGPAPDHGFRVEVVLPLAEQAPDARLPAVAQLTAGAVA